LDKDTDIIAFNMSSKPTPGPGAVGVAKEEKEKKRFSKFLSRAKTVLKRSDSTKRTSAVASKPTDSPKEPIKTIPVPDTKVDTQNRFESIPGVSKLSKAELFEERAKKLGERFGLEIKASEWHSVHPDDTVLRMDKPIRMRVRQTCHKCSANFNMGKECPACHHARCTKCVRYPPRRTETEIIASRENRAAILKSHKERAPIIPDYDFDGSQVYVLKRPSKMGRQDLVYKKPRQRVRRTCHQCQHLFTPGIKVCEGCGHVRCTDCPRDPPKKDKYPFGYPGDEFGPNSIPHYECEKCDTLYPVGSENGTPCAKCGQEKSDASPRAQPRKIEPDVPIDLEILMQVEAKIRALRLTEAAGGR